MIKLDRLKLVTNLKNIVSINEEKFITTYSNNKLLNYTYKSSTDNNLPYELYIKGDDERKELIIEFSSKILKNDYPKLINRDTIYQCFNNINSTGIIKLDTEEIIKDKR